MGELQHNWCARPSPVASTCGGIARGQDGHVKVRSATFHHHRSLHPSHRRRHRPSDRLWRRTPRRRRRVAGVGSRGECRRLAPGDRHPAQLRPRRAPAAPKPEDAAAIRSRHEVPQPSTPSLRFGRAASGRRRGGTTGSRCPPAPGPWGRTTTTASDARHRAEPQVGAASHQWSQRRAWSPQAPTGRAGARAEFVDTGHWGLTCSPPGAGGMGRAGTSKGCSRRGSRERPGADRGHLLCQLRRRRRSDRRRPSCGDAEVALGARGQRGRTPSTRSPSTSTTGERSGRSRCPGCAGSGRWSGHCSGSQRGLSSATADRLAVDARTPVTRVRQSPATVADLTVELDRSRPRRRVGAP